MPKKTLPNVTIEIVNCTECAECHGEIMWWSDDSWDTGTKYSCLKTKRKDKHIYSLDRFEKMPPVPRWCPKRPKVKKAKK